MSRLSVVVPVYKSGEYINKSSASILNSSFKDLELILVDDGSPDKSGELCEQIAAADLRVRVIHKQNGGISSARNAGIKAASGEYIAFVDQDDTVRVDMYEKLMNKASEGYDIVVSDFLLVYPDREEEYHTFNVYENHDDTYRDILLKGFGGNIWNMVVRRSIIVENDISFPEHLRHSEDVWFSLRLHLCTDKIAKIEESLYIYNLANPNQVSQHLDEQFSLCKMQCIDETISYIESKSKIDAYKQELFWLILQTKTGWIFTPSKYKIFREWHPEANAYIGNDPMLSKKMKFVMNLITQGMDGIAGLFAFLYKWSKRL